MAQTSRDQRIGIVAREAPVGGVDRTTCVCPATTVLRRRAGDGPSIGLGQYSPSGRGRPSCARTSPRVPTSPCTTH